MHMHLDITTVNKLELRFIC